MTKLKESQNKPTSDDKLKINSNDMSKEICNLCASSMKSYAKFKKLCHDSNRLWNSLMNQNLKCEIEKYTGQIAKMRKKRILPLSEDNLLYNNFANTDIKTEKKDIELDIEDDYTNDCNDFCEFNITNNENIDSKAEIEILNNSKVTSKKCVPEKRKKRIKHKGIKTYVKLPTSTLSYCGLCEFSSTDIDIVKDHVEEHRAKNDLCCKICDYTGADFANMVAHRFNHHPKEFKINLKCHICDKKCVQQLSLEFHYRSVHLGKKGGLCTICNKEMRNYIKFRNHERLHNKSTKRHICDHCGKEFLYRYEIEAHLADISDVKPYICDTCGKTFKRLRNMLLHQSSLHTIDPIKCSHCDKIFKNKISLDTHMRIYGTKKNLKCEICSKTFVKPYSLKSHMFWHTGERPHACNICGAKYKAKNQLTIHMRRHTGILPFKCAYCSRCFASSKQKKVHESVHTGLRANKCMYCERSFHGKKLLEAHCATRHNILDKSNLKNADGQED